MSHCSNLLALIVCALSLSMPAVAGEKSLPKFAPEDKVEQIITKAAHMVPSARQMDWQELEFVGFLHFGMNTFTDREWGEGTEDPKLFNPTQFDARQWVRACKAAGMKMVIVTAKHHDGFCLWPSKYTEHSVENSPWKNGKGDVVREVADACKKEGLKLSIYLSPWDRHEPTYGDSPSYNEYFKNQLRELLTNYGPIYDVWFDGACGEGPNGKRQEYDLPGFYALIRELAPQATISISAPDVRWCGNEAGHYRESEWSVVPDNYRYDDPDIGSREKIVAAVKAGRQLSWYPAQVDTSIRPGWFYHTSEDDKVKPLDHLLDVYYGCVGGNAQLLLNIPPDKRGLLHENDVKRLNEIGQVLMSTFSKNLAQNATATATAVRGNSPRFSPSNTLDRNKDSYWAPDEGITSASVEYDLGKPRTFNVAMLQESIAGEGQRVEEFCLDAWDGTGWKEIAKSTTIGYKRLLRFKDVTTDKVRVRITRSRVCPTLSNFGLYYQPPLNPAK